MSTLVHCALHNPLTELLSVVLFSFVMQNAGTAPSYFFEIRLDLFGMQVCGLFSVLEQTTECAKFE